MKSRRLTGDEITAMPLDDYAKVRGDLLDASSESTVPVTSIRCDACGAPSFGFALCLDCESLVAEHHNGEHGERDPNCPECLIIAE